MRSRSRVSIISIAGILAMALVIIGSTGAVTAKRPPKPSPPPPSSSPPPSNPLITIAIAPDGTLEPSGVYANVDVTVSCPVGWTWVSGHVNLLHSDRLGGGATFTASCTGTPQVATARAVNGNRFTLGNWNGSAYVTISRNGQEARADTARTVRLVPGVTARVADQGQLTGTSGGGVRLALAVACPIGATGQQSSVTVSQGTAQAQASFTPICDRFSHTFVLSLPASQGTFQTGSAAASASVTVGWNGESFSGADSRTITILESSTGDTTPPTTPAGLSASTFGDAEIWLSWGASSDNATPTGLIVYEVFLNGRFDQGICCGQTQAIMYGDLGVLNTIEVFAIDGAGNRSAPATVEVDFRF